MREKVNIIPIVFLQGIVIFPGSLIHFDISNEKSRQAIKAAMNRDQMVFLSMTDEEGKDKNKNPIGVVSKVKHYINLPNDTMRVLIEGVDRGKLIKFESDDKALVEGADQINDKDLDQEAIYAQIELVKDEGEVLLSYHEKEALLRNLKETFVKFSRKTGVIGKELVKQIRQIDSLREMIDEITTNIPLAIEKKQEIISTLDLMERYEKLSKFILDEIEIITIKKQYQSKIQAKVDKNQKEYLLREQLRIIKEELGEGQTDNIEEYLEKADRLIVSDEVKASIKSKIEKLENYNINSAEASIERKYIELLLELPWDKVTPENEDLNYTREVLERDHYGLLDIKERIIEFLSVRTLTKGGEAPIICLVGPPGTGKTSIAKSIAKSLKKEYVRISLGGVRDEAEIRGHRRTYVGALPGSIINGMKNAGVKNPVFLLDEIDKVGSSVRGDVSSALLEVLDSEQNDNFVDHFVEMPVDLSEILFISTANSVNNIPRPLLDRMEVIEVSSYTENEKYHIGRSFLYKKQLKNHGLARQDLTISDAAITSMIRGYTREAGVRSLERLFSKLCRKAAKEIVIDKKPKVSISVRNLEKYLGKEKHTYHKANRENQIGIIRGLAWTSVGGDTIEIEVNIMPGKGRFNITGKIGEVMKESSQAGISYIRSVSDKYDIAADFFDKKDIHIHIPEGAVAKDGPSAGITIATAIFSAATQQKVRSDLAMTGEVTIRGRVLPVGGLKEKILAAKTAHIKTVLLPSDNQRDVEEFDLEIRQGIDIEYVSNMDEVIKHALATND